MNPAGVPVRRWWEDCQPPQMQQSTAPSAKAPPQSMPAVQIGFMTAHFLKGDRRRPGSGGALSCVSERSCLALCALQAAHPGDVQWSGASPADVATWHP